MEIIETYWNVNELKAAREEAAVARNNRNILECKWVLVGDLKLLKLRNNRNILECKCSFTAAVIQRLGGNNRNILECK